MRYVAPLFPDFIQHSQVVDKDRSPKWQPSELADITQESLDAVFADMPSRDGLKREYLDK